MGVECPICNSRKAIIKNVYGGNSTDNKPSDIIAQVLECGHTIGGEEYDTYVKDSNKLESDTGEKIRKLKETCRTKKAALWKGVSDPEGDN